MSDERYRKYIAQQKSKQQLREITPPPAKEVRTYRANLHDAILRRLYFNVWGEHQYRTALCLAARDDAEVQAFRDFGLTAYGMDLRPVTGSKSVFIGDFHFIPLRDKSIDVVYFNSIDHSCKPELLMQEVHRVLKDDGIFMLEYQDVQSNHVSFGAWEAFWWDKNQIVVNLVQSNGFKIIHQVPFEIPWWGISATCKKA